MIERLIIKLTARWWNRLASRVLCRAYSCGVIDSRQLHILTKQFDPTQDGAVGRIRSGKQVEPFSFEHRAA